MKMTKESILTQVKNSANPKVKVAITDLDGVLRGKYLHKDKFLSAAESGFGFCDVVFGWDINDLAYEGMDFTGWHTGYPDANASLDLSTFRKVPWDNDVPFFLGDFNNDVCPRNLLRKIKAECEKKVHDKYIRKGLHTYFKSLRKKGKRVWFTRVPQVLRNWIYTPITGFQTLRVFRG